MDFSQYLTDTEGNHSNHSTITEDNKGFGHISIVRASEIDSNISEQLELEQKQIDHEDWKAGKAEWLILGCMFVVVLVVALDATILVSALPTIAHAIGASTLSTFWIGTSYLLAHAVVQPVISALSNIFGRTPALLVSIGFFTVGSIIACLAHNETEMLAARTVQGIGGGGILVCTQIILCDIIPLRQRGQYQAIPLLSYAVGTIAGPIIGGAFAQKATWRWIFYLNFPFCAIGLAIVPLVIKLRRAPAGLAEKISSIDWIGSMLFTTGITTALMAISWGGLQYGWSTYQTLVPLILGLAVFAVSLLYEARWAKAPFLQLHIYKSRSAVGCLVCVLLQGFLLYLGLYYIALFFLSVRLRTPTQTGISFLPLMITLMPSSAITGILVTRSGKYRNIIRVGWCLVTVGNGLLLLLSRSIPTGGWIAIFIVAGFGQGMVLTSLDVAIQASISPKYAADAGAMFVFLRSLGMALGVGIGGAIFSNCLSGHLAAAGLPISIADNAEQYVQVLVEQQYTDPVAVARVLDAYQSAFKNLFEVSTAVAATALLTSLLIKDSSLDKALETKHVLERGGS